MLYRDYLNGKYVFLLYRQNEILLSTQKLRRIAGNSAFAEWKMTAGNEN